MTTEQINNFIATQLEIWSEAKQNFDNLRHARRKPMPLGDFNVQLQLNPARIRSTAAAVDKTSIAKRPCFLCAKNRPKEQIALQWLDGWDLLVNPYPILPVHFTIPATTHIPQSALPLEMAAMAEQAPDLAIFFNGAKAGASAPDHMHCQAVLKSELPIVAIAEKNHSVERSGWVSSESFGIDLPFHFISGIITPDATGMKNLAMLEKAVGYDEKEGRVSHDLINAFVWIDGTGLLRIVIIPRKAHRPSHYFRKEDNYMVSPGALDMAGLLILPREEDFNRMTPDVLREIYAETAFTTLPQPVKSPFGI